MKLTALSARLLVCGLLLSSAGLALAEGGKFTLSSPDLKGKKFDNQFVLNGFGCKGGNVSPALEWKNLPAGATGVNGNYGGPCPPEGDKPHRYVFKLYALAVDDVQAAAGIPKTGSASLHSFVLNKGIGKGLLGTASFTATYKR